MTDEIKAAAERYRSDDRYYYAMSGMNQFMIGQSILARACLDHLDREAERALPVTVEWLKAIGFDYGIWFELSPDFGIEYRGAFTLHAESDDDGSEVYRLPLPHITTRGQVLDLLRLLGKEVKP